MTVMPSFLYTIDNVRRTFSRKHIQNLRGAGFQHILPGSGGIGTNVWRADHVIQRQERFRNARLLREYIQASTRYMAGLQRVQQSLVVNHAATGRVDDHHALLHLRKGSCIQQMLGFVRTVSGWQRPWLRC